MVNGLALCAGIGGLELGLSLALGTAYRTVCYCERDAFAAAALVARMEDASVDRAPIWDDLETFPGRAFCGAVDLITAGFPCQPWSVAGNKQGTEDERWLWPAIARIIHDVRPSIVFLENVPGLVAGGLQHVLSDLAESGFDAEWDVFRASDLGAPHRRARFFLLARRVPDAGGDQLRAEQGRGESRRGGEAVARDVGAWLEYTNGTRREKARCGPSLNPGEKPQPGSIGGLGDSACGGRRVLRLAQHGELEGQPRNQPNRPSNHGLQQWPPGPDAGPEHWPTGLEPAIRRVVNGPSDRLDRLRALGNGVVPSVAAHAFRTLWLRLALQNPYSNPKPGEQ